MSKSILVDENILYSKLDKMIEIAENNSTSKKGIFRMKEQRNNIHHAMKDTTELLEALEEELLNKHHQQYREWKYNDNVYNAEKNMIKIVLNKLHTALGGNKE